MVRISLFFGLMTHTGFGGDPNQIPVSNIGPCDPTVDP